MKPTVLKSEIVHENPWYRVRHDEFVRPNGNIGNYYVAEFPGAAAIVCVRDGQILTVSEYRYAIDATLIEFPIGRIEPGEQPLAAAKRELKEETGYDCEEMSLLGQIWTLKGAARMPLSIYQAQVGEQASAQKLDEGEAGLVARWMSLDDWRAAILDGRVADAETLAAWALYCEFLASNNKA